jgi:tetratricopeptide (TPR) repeat protein
VFALAAALPLALAWAAAPSGSSAPSDPSAPSAAPGSPAVPPVQSAPSAPPAPPASTPPAPASTPPAPASTPSTPSAPARKPPARAAEARPLPRVNLTGDIFFRVTAAEIAAQRGMYGSAAATLMSLARETSDPRLARRAMEFNLAGGNLPNAFEAARLWARLAPNDNEAASTELALAAANGQTRGLSQALRKRIDAASDKSAAIAQALAIAGRIKDRKLALRILDESFSESARKLPAASLALSDMAHAAGDDARALAEARAALAADAKSEAAVQRILEYGAKIDPGGAQAQAREFIARNPNARRTRLMLAQQLTDRGDHAAAPAELQAMRKLSPEDFDLIFIQAQLAYRSNLLDPARGLLEQYLSVQSQRQRAGQAGASQAVSSARELLASIAQRQGRLDDAIAELDRVQDPSMRFPARLRAGALRAKQGKIDEALTMIDAIAPQDDDERAQTAIAKAQILREAGRVEQAAAVLEDADRAMPDSADIKYELAMLNERRGRFEEFERLLRQVIALEPERAHAYNALGYTLADHNKRLPEALQLITRALSLEPNDTFILDSMGWVYFRMGKIDQAFDYLNRAYTQRPDPDIGAHLAEVLWRQGQRERAVELLREAQSKDGKNLTVEDTIKRLGVTL